MADRRFQILGDTIPPLLGRQAILQKMIGELTKATPGHLQVVGPRFSGKTVLLQELGRKLSDRTVSPYSSVAMMNLADHPPTSDEQFMARLCHELAAGLKEDHAQYADYLLAVQGNPYQEILEILDLLKDEKVKTLVIMDGFDKVLSSGQMTPNFWDNLRVLGEKPSLRFVTGSRRTLRQLIRHPDIEVSPFFNLFGAPPIRVGCFDEDDLSQILVSVNVEATPGAKKELWNATNGFPIFLLEVLNIVFAETRAQHFDNSDVARAIAKALPSLHDTIGLLWNDCPESSKDLLRVVLDQQSISRDGTAYEDVDTLVERGFVQQSGNKLLRPNRLLGDYLSGRPNESNALKLLFGGEDGYRQNFKGVLDHRISHVNGLNAKLRRYLERGLEDFPGTPEVFISNIRGIIDEVLELIWDTELGQRRVPSDWLAIWEHNREKGIEGFHTRFPQGVHRIRLLNLMTGTDKSDPVARYVSKSTYTLANAVHGFGDLGQHLEGTKIDTGTAYVAHLLCTELAASVMRELRVQ